MVVVLVVSAVAGAAGAVTAQSTEQAASVSFSGGTSGGSTLVVDDVRVPDGGFVTIHDDTLADGDVLGSVVGTSAYLEAGTHENVTVELTDGIDTGTFHAMAHRDTDGDRAYTFVSSNGGADGPYTVDGEIVTENAEVTASATVAAVDQPTEGSSVVVDRVELSEGGFVTVHDSSLGDGAVLESVRGTSEYLEAGVHEDVRVRLDDPLTENDSLFAMAHRDTNDDETYDFLATEGEADGPYLDGDDEIVMAGFDAELDDEARATFDARTSGGNAVVVDEVYLPDGGFVTMHDSSLGDGAVLESIRGTSGYLEPGVHRDVVVPLDDPLTEDGTLFAMAHRDTNDDETYDFLATDGAADGPYTTDSGDVVMDDGAVTVSASVAFDGRTADGTTVTVDRVDVSEGGFVTIHDASLAGGAVFDSVRGTSEYLEPGVHEDVVIELDEPTRDTHRLVAMPHTDSDGDRAYDFLATEGENDGPYVDGDGEIVMTDATVQVAAFVETSDQETDGGTVVVEDVTLHDGGFVTVHDDTLADGAVLESVRGTSEYLAPGTHTEVEVTLEDPLTEDGTVLAMAHRDTNGDETYDFLATDGAADGPYVAAGSPVTSSAELTITGGEATAEEDMSDDEVTADDGMAGDDGMGGSADGDGAEDGTMADGAGTEDGATTEDEMAANGTTDDDTPGFGVVAALVALVAGALVARRRP
nr:PGF-CTERM sorting domain-containing protein [Halorubrum halodurans]